VQQTQPFASSIVWSETSNDASMLSRPKSFTITPMRRPLAVARAWLTRVVLPAPRYPPTTIVIMLSGRAFTPPASLQRSESLPNAARAKIENCFNVAPHEALEKRGQRMKR
jgi:hypothetical protein